MLGDPRLPHAEASICSENDWAAASEAVTQVRSVNSHLSDAALGFLDRLLQLRVQDPLAAEFVMRFQQFTCPAMANGGEDTAFYCYNRFAALNEVGGDPSRFGSSVNDFHRACLALLSEIPGLWDFSLVVTDNPRPVDFDPRQVLMASVQAGIASGPTSGFLDELLSNQNRN